MGDRPIGNTVANGSAIRASSVVGGVSRRRQQRQVPRRDLHGGRPRRRDLPRLRHDQRQDRRLVARRRQRVRVPQQVRRQRCRCHRFRGRRARPATPRTRAATGDGDGRRLSRDVGHGRTALVEHDGACRAAARANTPRTRRRRVVVRRDAAPSCVFITDSWASRTVLDEPLPFHRLGLPQTAYAPADATASAWTSTHIRRTQR